MTVVDGASQRSGPCLSVEGLTVRYDDFTALDDVTFKAWSGEVLGLLGPNGAGKTTLVKSICGRIQPTDGEITVGTQLIKPRKVKPGLIGLVPQEIGLYPFLTAEENLEIFARIHGFEVKKRKEAVASALASVDMQEHAAKKISALSGGMKRRINFAAAILNRPALLILDEPTAGVDVSARDTIHKLARRLAGEGMGVILITHELEQAELVCDRVLVLAEGRKQYLATPDELLERIFAGQQQVTIRLRQTAVGNLSEQLGQIGFKPNDTATLWGGLISGDFNSKIEQARSEIGKTENMIQEVSVRRPGFETLLHQLASSSPQQHEGAI